MKLKKLPVEIIIAGENSVNLKLLMKKLSSKKIKTILVEGGGTVNWEFIKNNLFDELIVTLSPFLIGGTDSISFVEGKGFAKISNSPHLKLKSTNETWFFYISSGDVKDIYRDVFVVLLNKNPREQKCFYVINKNNTSESKELFNISNSTICEVLVGEKTITYTHLN